MGLRNLPADGAEPLASLVVCRPHEVASRALAAAGSGADLTLLAFDEDEGVSEEVYFGDTLYLAVEGAARVVLPSGGVAIAEGACLMVPAGVEHAVYADGGPLKLLQLTVA